MRWTRPPPSHVAGDRTRIGAGAPPAPVAGHRGRVAIYELFLLNEAVSDLIQPGVKTSELRAEARKSGWRSLSENAWPKVQRGLITLAEQERWTRKIESGLPDPPA